MKIGILILVRLGSTRLANKHLLGVKETNFLSVLVERFNTAFSNENLPVIIATSEMPMNKHLEGYVDPKKASIFFGNDTNIPKRQLQCAEHFGLTHIISIDGDDILCSTTAARIVQKKLESGSEGVKTTGLPIGLNVMGYEVGLLKDCMEAALNEQESEKIETGWGRIFKNRLEEVDLDFQGKQHISNLRFTLDYPDDERFFRRVIEEFPDDIIIASDDALINFVLTAGIYKENNFLSDEYNLNFNAQKKNEINNND